VVFLVGEGRCVRSLLRRTTQVERLTPLVHTLVRDTYAHLHAAARTRRGLHLHTCRRRRRRRRRRGAQPSDANARARGHSRVPRGNEPPAIYE